MSSDNTSEERSLPPSRRKLRELRKKAEIPRSADMVAGAATSAALVFLWLRGRDFIAKLNAAVLSILNLDRHDFNVTAHDAVAILFTSAAQFVGALIAVVVFTVIIANILVNRGFLFSLEPIKFNLARVNPLEGFKRMFSIKSAMEALKGFIKIVPFLALSVFLFAGNLNAAFYVPFCNADCLVGVFGGMIKPIVILAIVILLLAGVLDIGIQQWLFLRRQKMTKSEARRDYRETEGSPELRQAHRRLRGELVERPRRYAAEEATIFIAGTDTIVGVRFVRGETPVPVIVTKARGQKALDMRELALDNKVPVYVDDDLSGRLFQKLEPSQSISEEFFEPFIRALAALRLL
jgi:type III secretion protein U